MDNNFNQENTFLDTPAAIIPESPLPEGPDPVELEKRARTRVRKVYNSACLTMLIQFGIASVITSFISTIYSAYISFMTVIQNPELDFEALLESIMETSMSPVFLLTTTAVAYLAANIVSYFIGNKMIKKHHTASIFGKIQMKPLDCILAVVGVIGVQMASALIQSLVMSLTGMTGIDENTAAMVSISDNVFQNIVLVLYTVVIAGITEELLCRGVIMKALSVKSVTFGLIASSALFGIMHGNFNQMFNGFLLGLVIGYVGIKSKSIFMPIILHMCANGHAMLWSALEFKFGKSIFAIEALYIIAIAIIGVGAAIWLYLRNGKPNDETDGFPVTSTIEELPKTESRKGWTWSVIVKSPAFWIFIAIYFFTALITISPLIVN